MHIPLWWLLRSSVLTVLMVTHSCLHGSDWGAAIHSGVMPAAVAAHLCSEGLELLEGFVRGNLQSVVWLIHLLQWFDYLWIWINWLPGWAVSAVSTARCNCILFFLFYFSLNWYQNQPLHLWGLSTAEACAGGSHISEELLRDKGVQNAWHQRAALGNEMHPVL